VRFEEPTKWELFCAYQRRGLYRGTAREYREHETVRMCLDMKDVNFYQFDTEKPRYV
jgi:hypothetical protein